MLVKATWFSFQKRFVFGPVRASAWLVGANYVSNKLKIVSVYITSIYSTKLSAGPTRGEGYGQNFWDPDPAGSETCVVTKSYIGTVEGYE